MKELEFDKAIAGAVAKAINSGIEPCVCIGVLEAVKLDVWSHMKKAQAAARCAQAPSILTPDQIESLKKKGHG